MHGPGPRRRRLTRDARPVREQDHDAGHHHAVDHGADGALSPGRRQSPTHLRHGTGRRVRTRRHRCPPSVPNWPRTRRSLRRRWWSRSCLRPSVASSGTCRIPSASSWGWISDPFRREGSVGLRVGAVSDIVPSSSDEPSMPMPLPSDRRAAEGRAGVEGEQGPFQEPDREHRCEHLVKPLDLDALEVLLAQMDPSEGEEASAS